MNHEKAVLALEALVDTIEATGGLDRNEDGELSPVVDPEWSDLGSAYLLACEALGRKPEMPTPSHRNECPGDSL